MINYDKMPLKLVLKLVLIISFLFINVGAINTYTIGSENNIKRQPPYYSYSQNWVDSVYNSLSDDEKIAQLFMVAAYPKKGEVSKTHITNLIKKYKIGGLIMFHATPVMQAKQTNYYQSISATPLMIAGDYEWGLPMRVDNTIRYPRQMMLGAIQDDKLIYQMGVDIAKQCRRLGIHVNFAPVIDINNNPNNPVINSRSFGEIPGNVIRKGMQYMYGMQDNQVLATAKHFPGHGDTDVDSHKNLPVILHSKKRLDTMELLPFKALINSGLGAVMIAHLHIPALDSTKNLASSLSKPIVTGLLKKELNFKGLIFTDALNMKGVSKFFKKGEVDAKALVAGADILLMSEDVPLAITEIKKAIKRGEITQKEINKRCRKILMAKKWLGLNNYKPIKIKNLNEDLNKIEYKILKDKLIENALTLAVNNEGIIPFKNLDKQTIASVAIGNGQISSFQTRLKMYDDVKNFSMLNGADNSIQKNLISKLLKYDVVVVSVHQMNRRPPKFGLKNSSIDFIDKLSEKTKVVLVVFGNPYALKYVKRPEKLSAVLVAYNGWRPTRDLAAQLLFGGIEAKGKLPVSAGQYFKAGDGQMEAKIRLKYGIPEELKIPKSKLKDVDSIILKAIRDKATPGATIMAIKNGIVFYHKSFGTHTYDKKQKNKNSDIYDLASLTKITATLPSIMKLQDEGKINVNQKLSVYLPELLNTNKKNIYIKDILAHQAQLKPWIPFYLRTYKDRETYLLDDKIYSTKKTKKYPYKVADNLYIIKSYEDSIFQRIYDSPLRKRKRYKYSDFGFIMLYRTIEKITETPLEDYTRNNFYSKLGATTLGYKPIERFSKNQIVPTEEDYYMRKQLLQGYVHDYAAAMTDCVNGHAGIFSNANDLAKLMQMYLNGGTYGGVKYINKETLAKFEKCAFCRNNNRRGLGFDRPKRQGGGSCSSLASPTSYGHTGFTGTIAWIDPEDDFIYIFLSNRINPNIENKKLARENIRQKIQSVFYRSFPEYSMQQIDENSVN